MKSNGKVNILVVDDRPERVLTLSAVLEELGENVVGASSGREALRHLLHMEFAVILLDINMPGMDGFETAALIRQRPSTRDVPIIFVTAYQDEVQLVHGYSMRAVDYIQVPVVPEILRTKVGVFVDLYKRTEQVRRQADWLRHRAAQLHKLTSASLAINSAISLETLLDVVTSTAREVLDVNIASATIAEAGPLGALPPRPAASGQADTPTRYRTAASLSSKYMGSAQTDDGAPSVIRDLLRRDNRPVRMTQHELDVHPAWTSQDKTWRGLPLRGWLAVPLTGRDGNNLGWIEVTDKNDARSSELGADFNGDDEAILIQLAQMTSIAVENAMFAQEREVNQLKDEFLWTLSHELRTPLNAILGWTQLMAMGELNEDVAHGVEVIDRNARAQAKLVDDMLDLSRIIMGKLRLNRRSLDLRSVVEAAVESVRPLADTKGLTLESACGPRPAPVHGDPDRLQQIVWNLLSNALKFTPAGGRIQVALEQAPRTATIRVVDNGQGIKRSFLPHVFERFRQADSSTVRLHTGLGIGLTIVRHIAELHGGSVRAESSGEGHGATFSVELPTNATAEISKATPPEGRRSSTTPAIQGARPAAGEPPLPSLAGLRVLFVDDEPDAQQALALLLRHSGAEVVLASSAEQALREISQRPPDVLVSDIGMPHKDGYALIRAVRDLPAERGRDLPAIALTAYAREQDGLRAKRAGFHMHLAKPVDSTRLLEAIGQVGRIAADSAAGTDDQASRWGAESGQEHSDHNGQTVKASDA